MTRGRSTGEAVEELLNRVLRRELQEAIARGEQVQVDFEQVERFDIELADEILSNPFEAFKYIEKVLHKSVDLPVDVPSGLRLRIKGLPSEARVAVSDLRSRHINNLIAIKGLIRKATPVRPRFVAAAFECRRCGEHQRVAQDEHEFSEPFICRGCERKGPFEIIMKESDFVDSQKLQLQESPEDLVGGEQPRSINVYLNQDLCGKINPGDRAVVNGILCSRHKMTRGQKQAALDMYVNAHSLEIRDKDFEEIEISKEEREEIEEMAMDRGIYGKIIDSIAPTIYGYENVKEAIALQLFGGLSKNMPDDSYIRGDIHVLLIGDPGMGKSQILRYVRNLAPRGVYASGKSSSAAGLTAAAVKDEFGDGRWTFEAGALVLADKGVAAIDEVDKMRDDDREALHEALEQQSVSLAKAGMTTTLQTRCAMLGAANPVHGRFEQYEPIADQINIEPALLSRFDLIFTLTDKPSEELDGKIARHILAVHEAGAKTEEVSSEQVELKSIVEPDLMRKYIAEAKTITPVLSKEAMDRLEAFYKGLRGGVDGDSPVPVTARQLEALIRLSEASARVRLSSVVADKDAQRAIRIVKTCLAEVGVDPETGEQDIDLLATGVSKSQRDKIMTLKKIIRRLSDESGGMAPVDDVITVAVDKGLGKDDTKDKIRKLREEGEVFYPERGYLRLA